MLEEDVTEIGENVDIIELAGIKVDLLEAQECWSNPSTVTATSIPVPELSKPIEPASEHPQAASATISMTS